MVNSERIAVHSTLDSDRDGSAPGDVLDLAKRFF